ncbi:MULTISPECIES: hypothetical protein [unclassified Microcoleus]|uniref:hypothetical protein n=2 Tax=unclassified Microcoleus TaxID=2642155 RepID=UPI0025E2D1CC|nr:MULTISPECIES: hypothetical protein [unclassified Microcoleus]
MQCDRPRESYLSANIVNIFLYYYKNNLQLMAKFNGDSKGFNPALIWFVLFTVGFRLVGCSLPVSLGLGVIGGVAAGLIVAWWHNELLLNPNTGSKDKKSDAILNKEVVEVNGHKYKTSRREPTSFFDWLSEPEDRR